MAALSISMEEIYLRAYDNNKIVICEVEKRRTDRYFKTKCNLCGMEKEQRIHMFFKCKGCMINKLSKDTPWFIEQSRKVHGNKYDYSESFYINTAKPLEIRCTDCNTIFYQIPYNHLRGRGCSRCNESKGEVRVTKYLKKKGIAFKPQQEFKDLKHKKCLKFDFYLTEHNILAEYDGVGHYKATFGSTPEEKQKNFEDCQRRDKIKNEWAKANNIPLLRIPYWDFDRIEELIEAFILQHTKKKEIKQLVMEI
jgi:hypothetical protein